MKRSGFAVVVILLSAALVHAQSCQIAGQVFFSDVVDRTITIKTDAGDLVNFSYDDAASFVQGADRVSPRQLNNGDRLCVRTIKPVVVSVTSRAEIEAMQKKELAAWQADSLYGIVSGLDLKTRKITLAVSLSGKYTSYSVDVSPDVACWFFPLGTIRLKDAVAGSVERITPGDTVYVRGKKGLGQNFAASLIVSGGFRSFAATIESTDVLDEKLRVRLVLSGNARTVHIGLGELYAIGANGDGRRLFRIDAADLQPGDTVLMLGIGDGDSVRAWALIAGFSPFGAIPPDPSEQMRWVFDNVPLGDPYLAPPQ